MTRLIPFSCLHSKVRLDSREEKPKNLVLTSGYDELQTRRRGFQFKTARDDNNDSSVFFTSSPSSFTETDMSQNSWHDLIVMKYLSLLIPAAVSLRTRVATCPV